MNETAGQPWEDELQALGQTYNLELVPLDIGTHHLHITKVANMDDLLDRITDPDELPFWAELWPAAIGLASFILEQPTGFRYRHVLELGAGTGLVGIAAKLAGAAVVQSDFIPEAIRFTALNCRRNSVPVGEQLLADWRRFPDDVGPFDAVIGADVLYEKDFHDALLSVLGKTLTPDGTVWLGDPGRDYAKRFMGKAEAAGWTVTRQQISINYQSKDYRIDIYRLRRRPETG